MRLKISFFILIMLFLMFGCAQPVPNPIIGAYTMPDAVNPNYDNASLALKEDGTFIYVERITSNSQYQVRIDGTYDISIESYDFVSANGLITLSVGDDQIPDGISDLILKKGGNSFLFDWSCDRNNGPQDMTFVIDPMDSTKNYEFEYIGASNKLDREESVLPEWLLPEEEPGEDQDDDPSAEEPGSDIEDGTDSDIDGTDDGNTDAGEEDTSPDDSDTDPVEPEVTE